MAFCLAGALSFNLASPESDDNRPVFAQLMLDEAFSKSDPQFAQQALQAFRKFGFQLVIVATVQNATTIQPYIDSVVMVSKTEATGRNARPVASVRDPDDRGVHDVAPRDAGDGGTGAGRGLTRATPGSSSRAPGTHRRLRIRRRMTALRTDRRNRGADRRLRRSASIGV